MAAQEIRQPVVVGQFYEGSAEGLTRQIEECYEHKLGPGSLPQVNERGPRRIVGLISPHAGYVYSGPTAAHGFYELALDGRPEVAAVIGVNHGRAYGSAVQTAGAWRTPLGDLPVASEVAEQIAHTPRVISFRNALIHGYDLVDHELVWDVVETHLPSLHEQVASLLAGND